MSLVERNKETLCIRHCLAKPSQKRPTVVHEGVGVAADDEVEAAHEVDHLLVPVGPGVVAAVSHRNHDPNA